MKSNRTRPIRVGAGATLRIPHQRPPEATQEVGAIDLDGMPAPAVIEKIAPERIIADILVATLSRVQRDSSPEIAEAAEKFISVLRRKQ